MEDSLLFKLQKYITTHSEDTTFFDASLGVGNRCVTNKNVTVHLEVIIQTVKISRTKCQNNLHKNMMSRKCVGLYCDADKGRRAKQKKY